MAIDIPLIGTTICHVSPTLSPCHLLIVTNCGYNQVPASEPPLDPFSSRALPLRRPALENGSMDGHCVPCDYNLQIEDKTGSGGGGCLHGLSRVRAEQQRTGSDDLIKNSSLLSAKLLILRQCHSVAPLTRPVRLTSCCVQLIVNEHDKGQTGPAPQFH